MDQREAIDKANRFADTAYVAEQGRIIREYQEKMGQMRAELARRGLIHSGYMYSDSARIRGEQIRALVEAKLDAKLEGYELYGITIDAEMANLLVGEMIAFMEEMLAKSQNSIPVGTPKDLESQYPQAVSQRIGLSPAWIKTHIDRRRLMWKTNEDNRQNVQVHIHHAANVNLGTQVGTINAILHTVEEQSGSNHEIVRALKELTDAVSRDQKYNEHEKREALEVIQGIAKQAEAKPQERSAGTLKVLITGLPTLLTASKDILDLWDRCSPVIRHFFRL